MRWFRRKDLFDRVRDGELDDGVIARRMKEWMSKGTPQVAARAVRLYQKQDSEKKRVFADHGLTPEFVEKTKLKISRQVTIQKNKK